MPFFPKLSKFIIQYLPFIMGMIENFIHQVKAIEFIILEAGYYLQSQKICSRLGRLSLGLLCLSCSFGNLSRFYFIIRLVYT